MPVPDARSDSDGCRFSQLDSANGPECYCPGGASVDPRIAVPLASRPATAVCERGSTLPSKPATGRAVLADAAAAARARDHARAVAILDGFIDAETAAGRTPAPSLFLRRAQSHNRLMNWRAAEADARHAVKMLAARRAADTTMAEACAELGQASWHVHGAVASLPWYRRSRRLHEQSGGAPAHLAAAYDNEALCLHALGRLETAKRRQRQGLAIATRHGLHGRRRSLLRRMANVMQDQGHEDEAANLLQAARPPARAPVSERLGWHHAQALLAERRGLPALAEVHYDRATELFEANPERVRDMVACLLNSALLKAQLQSREQARRLLEVAERSAPADPPSSYFVKRGVADALDAAADGDIARASALFAEVRRRARLRNPGNYGYEAEIVAQHAGLLRRAGEIEAARELLESLIPGADGADAIPPGAEQVALQLVELRLDEDGDLRGAIGLLRPLFAHFLAVADEESRWRIFSATAEVAARAGRSDTAILFGKLAVEQAVASLAAFSPDAHEHQAILAQRQAPFLAVFRRLVARERLVEASRIQALLQMERSRGLAMRRSPYRQDSSLALMTDTEMSRREELMELLGAARRSAATAADALASERRRQLAAASFAEAGTALGALLDASLEPQAPGVIADRDDLPAADEERPGPGSVILRYFVVAGRTMLQVASSDGIAVRKLDIERPALLSQVFEFVEALRRGAPAETGARALHQTLIAPAMELIGDAARIDVVAEGALSALPFAALHDGEGYLVRRHAFAYRSGAPLAASPTGTRRPARARLFGVSKAAAGLPALPRVPDELAGVAMALPGARKRLDSRFTARALRRALAEGADAIHVASHHHLVPGSPTRSFLLMGDGERLPIAAFFSGEFTWERVALVFLSGCETAAGDTTLEGGETIAAAFHQAGVADVVATVWPAADVSASLLAPRFYRALGDGAATAEALQRAQLALLGANGEPPEQASAMPAEAVEHPLHWAPFKLFVHGR